MIRIRHAVLLGSAAIALMPVWAQAQETAKADESDNNSIVVTARKREERLLDIPVAATAVTGDAIEQRGLVSVKEVATLTPSLNINSDGAGRAFIAIRGVGTTLIDTVQPGVGIFVDGIYQPNTSYLNNPMTDVERVEVLRGPQGTLYGKNTLGGAINVISRQPGNDLEFKAIGSYAGTDHAWNAGASLSGALVEDRVMARVSYAHQQQNGFVRNTLINADAFPLNSDTVSGTLVLKPSDDVKLTVNGYDTWLKGGGVSYAFVTGPTDYNRSVRLNATNHQLFDYRGVNAKLEFPLDAFSTKVTLIGAYDERDVNTPDADPDFTANNVLRSDGHDDLKTRTLELRFDSDLSSTLSSIVGAFYSRETRTTDSNVHVLPGVLNLLNTTSVTSAGDTYALFGNLFWKPSADWEFSAGLRWDRQDRSLVTAAVNQFPAPGTINTNQKLQETNVSPRFALTRHWNGNVMSYASVAKGFRGGGFNRSGALPESLRTYKGDRVWTYELGSKFESNDRRLALSAAVFYNDYKDYIGLNSIYAVPPSFVTVDLNTGDVKSYGIELEGSFKPASIWTLSGGVSLMNARIVDSTIYTQTLHRKLASDRLPFQPDWNLHFDSDVVVPVGKNEVAFNLGVVGKGSRIAATLSETNAPVLASYLLTNSSITYRTGKFEIGAFVTNLFNKNYMESYIEKTTLILAGLPATDVGIAGERRRIGVRARVRF